MQGEVVEGAGVRVETAVGVSVEMVERVEMVETGEMVEMVEMVEGCTVSNWNLGGGKEA